MESLPNYLLSSTFRPEADYTLNQSSNMLSVSSSSDSEGEVFQPLPKEPDEVQQVKTYTKSENIHVKLGRFIVVITLLVTGGLVSSFTYLYLWNSERQAAISAYRQFAASVQDTVQFRVETMFLALNTMSESLTAYMENTNQTWPFLVHPTFEVIANHARQLSGVETLGFIPFVGEEDRLDWEEFSYQNQDWIDESRNVALQNDERLRETDYVNGTISPVIFDLSSAGVPAYAAPGQRIFTPVSMSSPPPFSPQLQNFNLYSILESRLQTDTMQATSALEDASRIAGAAYSIEAHEAYHAQFVDSADHDALSRPHAFLYTPIYRHFGTHESSDVVGALLSAVAFDFYLSRLPNSEGIIAVLQSSCNQSASYRLEGNRSIFVGYGDLHDNQFNEERVSLVFGDYRYPETTIAAEGHCVYELNIFPSESIIERYKTNLPLGATVAVAATFLLMAATFCLYDFFVYRRNTKVVHAAARSNAIVSSLFPKSVKERLFEEAQNLDKQKLKTASVESGDNSNAKSDIFSSKPIAEQFESTTILFGDLAGFTAWSTNREPQHVFTLLETLYHAFDDIAARRHIYKVETVGDCYVAVSGLPERRQDHAVAMARFARDILYKQRSITKQLAETLGSDTATLALRIGIHSGPVTAGVLRGSNSRFQLFGDTMNTAARMESNGKRDQIHISSETAELLVVSGKGSWITRREDPIFAKGLGELQTYWLLTDSTCFQSQGSEQSLASESNDSSPTYSCFDTMNGKHLTGDQQFALLGERMKGIVERNVAVLGYYLKRVQKAHGDVSFFEKNEVSHGCNNAKQPWSTISAQLKLFVARIFALYNEDNPFHNADHASHAIESMQVMLDSQQFDPLTEFACVFSALIREVQHAGAPTKRIKQESLSSQEHRGLQTGWGLLALTEFSALRSALCPTGAEEERLLKVVTHCLVPAQYSGEDSPVVPKTEEGRAKLIVDASDIFYALQEWRIYRKWSSRMFLEHFMTDFTVVAEMHPSIYWYEEELKFFDSVVIPLSKQLAACGISRENSLYQFNADNNREKWVKEGVQEVQNLSAKIKPDVGDRLAV